MDMPELADQQELIYNSSVRTHDFVRKNCRGRWIIETEEESLENPCCQRDDDDISTLIW